MMPEVLPVVGRMSAVGLSAIRFAPLIPLTPLASAAVAHDAHPRIGQKLFAHTDQRILLVLRDDREEPNRIVPQRGCPNLARDSRRDGSRPRVGQSTNLVHVLALDADEPGWTLAPRGVDVAFVVDVRHARPERVAPGVADPARRVLAGGLHERPVSHPGLATRLAVDRPGRTLIVRR